MPARMLFIAVACVLVVFTVVASDLLGSSHEVPASLLLSLASPTGIQQRQAVHLARPPRAAPAAVGIITLFPPNRRLQPLRMVSASVPSGHGSVSSVAVPFTTLILLVFVGVCAAVFPRKDLWRRMKPAQLEQAEALEQTQSAWVGYALVKIDYEWDRDRQWKRRLAAKAIDNDEQAALNELIASVEFAPCIENAAKRARLPETLIRRELERFFAVLPSGLYHRPPAGHGEYLTYAVSPPVGAAFSSLLEYVDVPHTVEVKYRYEWHNTR